MKISERLSTIASFIDKDAFVMDVGADHGLLEKYLIDNEIVKHIIAVENKKGPLDILKNNLIGYDITISYSDGIKDITPEVDTLVLAGMGGMLIVNILNSDSSKLKNVKHIIIDAHKDIEFVRREISKLGYYIKTEKIVYENNIYYFVINFESGNKKLTDIEYEFGVNISMDPLFEKYRESQIEKMMEISKFDESIKEKIERLKSLWIKTHFSEH